METREILVIDDEENIVRALGRTLRLNGYNPIGTTSPAEAISILDAGKVAVVISDQRMPKMTGVEILQHAKQVSPNTVRILMTGYADFAAAVAAINDSRIFHYIAKPWTDDELMSVVDNAITYRNDQLNKEVILDTLLKEKEDWKETFDRLLLMMGFSVNSALSAMQKIIQVKDEALYQHSRRVEKIAGRLADDLALAEERKTNLSLACLFHDIGKIAIKDKILYKSGPLNRSETGRIWQHPMYGAEIVRELGFLDQVAEIILQHHEKVDGTGYPQRLAGDGIMLEARILAVADAYDAMTSDRVYRKAMPGEEACRIMQQASGSHFDPGVLDLFVKRGDMEMVTAGSDGGIIVDKG